VRQARRGAIGGSRRVGCAPRHAPGGLPCLPPHLPFISRTVRTDVELPADISEIELRQYALETELRQARDRIRHLEQAIRTTAKVLAPYAGGNGTGR
jgi:hypothetical protein